MKAQIVARLTPLQKAILGQLSRTKPTKAEVIALRLGKKSCSGSFRSLLSDLERFGLVRHVKRVGYRLT